MKVFLVVNAFLFLLVLKTYSQDSLLIKGLTANKHEFNYSDADEFTGSGWDSIISEANKNQYFLIGEVHGINEIPMFIDALTKQVRYQTFVAEIDPFLNRIIQNKIEQLPKAQLQEWFQQNGGKLSFYSYKEDFELLNKLNKRGTRVIGIDQITALNDVPVYLYLSELTTDKKRKEDYLRMAKTAEKMFSELLKDPSKPPYLMSSNFQSDLNIIQKQNLSMQEQAIIEKLQNSRYIYTTRGGHQKRIKLMKNQLMNQYDSSLLDKKALFRLGANHSPKGESFLKVFDVGNLAHNLAESQFNSSYHLAIFPKSGEVGHPLKGNPNTKVEQQNDLSSFYALAEDDKWTFFNLKPLRQQLEGGKLEVKNEFLERVLKGYDGLLIIPKSTAGQHVN